MVSLIQRVKNVKNLVLARLDMILERLQSVEARQEVLASAQQALSSRQETILAQQETLGPRLDSLLSMDASVLQAAVYLVESLQQLGQIHTQQHEQALQHFLALRQRLESYRTQPEPSPQPSKDLKAA